MGDEVLAGHPFVVAHRGASAARPEHTLAAYELALKEGADGVECDVRLTRDGHLVCVHDRRLDRTSTGAGLVSTMTLAELRELEYGAWHDSWRAGRRARRHQPADAGRPRFAGSGLEPAGEDLHRDQASGPVRLTGGEQAAGTAASLRHRRAGLRGPVARGGDVVFGGRGLAGPASRAAAAHRAARQDRPIPDQQRGHCRRGNRRRSVDGALRDYPQLVDRAAAQGRSVYCWTVDEYDDIDFCRDVGVAWIATNHPGRTKAWLENAHRGSSADGRPAGPASCPQAARHRRVGAQRVEQLRAPHRGSTPPPIRVAVGELADRDRDRGDGSVQRPAEAGQVPNVVALVTVRASAAARGTEYQRHGLSHTAGLAARCSSADMNCRWLTIRSRSARGVARVLT